ncbi:unnamed protein product [Protopolystoma xenopodis]|uniref:Cadherin domain-containing protein n=1 Tax=Protopolystoma xenopodis TaxID=117903 RepID=A0A3S5A2U8_9PLAT|nr:unnamed protein product [Protopolystoma xenopodis]
MKTNRHITARDPICAGAAALAYSMEQVAGPTTATSVFSIHAETGRVCLADRLDSAERQLDGRFIADATTPPSHEYLLRVTVEDQCTTCYNHPSLDKFICRTNHILFCQESLTPIVRLLRL